MAIQCLLRRRASLGDVISVEPVTRALYKKAEFNRIVIDCGDFNAVFDNSPYATCDLELGEPFTLFELDNTYERQLERLREDVYLQMCGTSLTDEEKMPRLYLSQEEQCWCKTMLTADDWVILDTNYPTPQGAFFRGVFEGESKAWRRAHWPPEIWSVLVREFQGKGYKVVQVGNRREVEPIRGVDLDLTNKTTLRQLFAIASQCKIFVGIESGVFHVCQALGLAGVGIFHPQHPHTSLQPPGSSLKAVYRKEGMPLDAEELLILALS